MPAPTHQLQANFLAASEEHADGLFRHCYGRLLDRKRSLEAVEQTFMRSWCAIAQGAPFADPKAFLYRIANEVIATLERSAAASDAPARPEAGESLESIFSQSHAGDSMHVSGGLLAARLRNGRHVFLSLNRYV